MEWENRARGRHPAEIKRHLLAARRHVSNFDFTHMESQLRSDNSLLHDCAWPVTHQQPYFVRQAHRVGGAYAESSHSNARA